MLEHSVRDQVRLSRGTRLALNGRGRLGVVITAAAGGLALGVLIGFSLGGGQWRFLSRRYELKAYMSQQMGLHEGSPVMLAGIPVGTVTAVTVAPYPEVKPVEIRIRVDRKYRDYIRADSVAEVSRAGFLGENYLEISRGQPNQPALARGGVVALREGTGLENTVIWKTVRGLLTSGR